MLIQYKKDKGVDVEFIFRYIYLTLNIHYFHFLFFLKRVYKKEKKENIGFIKEM